MAVWCGLSLFYAAGARNGHAQRDGKREDKGVAILSTLPLSDFIAVELPYEAARRVAVAATVHGPRGDSLRVVSVHLVSVTPVWRIFRTGNSSRQRQALAVVDALRVAERLRAGPANSAAQESVPCCEQREGALASYAIATVVAGDLNTWSTRETALRHLLDHFPQSPRPLAESTRGPFPTDHIFFRVDGTGEGARVLDSTYRRIDDTYYSDHNPIVALLSFHRPPRDSGARSISKKDGG